MKATIIKREKYDLLITCGYEVDDDEYWVKIDMSKGDIGGAVGTVKYGFNKDKKDDALIAYDKVVKSPEDYFQYKRFIDILNIDAQEETNGKD